MISAIEAQEAKNIVLTTKMQGPKMLLRYYSLLSSEQGRGNGGLFLLCICLREVQQQDHACVCRGDKKSLNDRLNRGGVSYGGFTWVFHSPAWKLYLLQLSK